MNLTFYILSVTIRLSCLKYWCEIPIPCIEVVWRLWREVLPVGTQMTDERHVMLLHPHDHHLGNLVCTPCIEMSIVGQFLVLSLECSGRIMYEGTLAVLFAKRLEESAGHIV